MVKILMERRRDLLGISKPVLVINDFKTIVVHSSKGHNSFDLKQF